MSITVRPADPRDYHAIYEIHLLAFGGENEAQLVEKLRCRSDFIPQLSLIAENDGQVVGHILFSRVILESQDEILSILTLAPMAVHPEFQNHGIGSELVRQGLLACREWAKTVVVVLGHPDFYPRFGFKQAHEVGIRAPFPVPDEAFMVIELSPGALDGISGTVKYPQIFDGV